MPDRSTSARMLSSTKSSESQKVIEKDEKICQTFGVFIRKYIHLMFFGGFFVFGILCVLAQKNIYII